MNDPIANPDAMAAFSAAHWFGDLVGRDFGCVLADPPWAYDCTDPTCSPGGKVTGYSGGVSLYYDTMTAQQIAAMPVQAIAAKDSVIFLWATVPLLPDAFGVMVAWGYKYKTMLTWEKENGKGMGYWFRGVTEHCLLGVRGDVKAFRSPIKNLIRNKVGRHSAKPQQIHDIIESVTPEMDRLELFSRLHRTGWTVWGNQVERDLLSPNKKVTDGA